jgi:glycosyltransferase involved in cell wall biosynthesis
MNNVKKKTKIGLIHHSTGFGGGTKSFVDLINLLSLKFELVIFIPKDSPTISSLIKSHRIIFINYPIPNLGLYSGGKKIFSRTFLTNLFYSKKFSKLIAEKINSENLDYLILNTIVISPLIKHISSNTRIIVYCRETIISIFDRFIYTKMLNKYSFAVFFISKQELINFNSLKTTKLFLPDTYNLELVNKILSKEKKVNEVKRIIFLGGLDRIKGFDTLLSSLKYFKKINFRIQFYGKFDHSKFSRRNLLNLLLKLNLHDFLFFFRIKILLRRFIKFIDFKNYRLVIENEIFNSDILVFPSSHPHQSRPFIEAGTLKTLVIISDFKETRDVYINNSNCLTFKPNSSKALYNQIFFALNQDNKRIIDINYNFSYYYFSPVFVQETLTSFFLDKI